MKKLDWFIIKSYIGPFIMTFFISAFVLVIQFIFVYVDDLMGKGVGVGVILELIFYIFLDVVPMSLPLAVLLSSIMLMGNLAEKNELTAMKSAGMSLFRILKPLIIFMLFVSFTSFIFSNYIWQEANFRRKIIIRDITQKKLALVFKDNIFFNEIEKTSIRAKKVDKENNILHDVLIYTHQNVFKFRRVIKAERAEMEKAADGKELVLTLHNGEIVERINPRKNDIEQKSINPTNRIKFKSTVQRIDLSSLDFNRTTKDDYKQQLHTFPVSKITYFIDSLNKGYVKYKNDISNSVKKSFFPLLDSTINRNSNSAKKLDSFNINDVSPFEEIQALKNTLKTINSNMFYVENSIKQYKLKEKQIRRLKIEWNRKLTLSFACIILFFIGAPLGVMFQKGGFGLPLVLSIILFFFYHVISVAGERMAKEGSIDPIFGMWLSAIVLFPFGIYLTYKAAKESKISKPTFRFFKRFKK